MKDYKIRKGMHYSLHMPKFHIGRKTFKAKAMLTSSCKDDGKSKHINKLFGVSFGNHHSNSVRLGWRYNKEFDVFEILTYIYRDGVVSDSHVWSIPADQEMDIKMSFIGDKVFIAIDDIETATTFVRPYIKAGYCLFPYYGGGPKAPHTMNIKLDIYALD